MSHPRPRHLVTAGNTREMIDRVRDWGNVFTGNTGFAIARALAEAGGEVDLLTSNRGHVEEAREVPNLHASSFTSHADLKGAIAALMTRGRYAGVFMTAAVADYAPAGVFEIVWRAPGAAAGEEVWTVRDVSAAKVKSNHPQIAVVGRPTQKLVDLFRTEWNHRGLLVKFKLEVGITAERLLEIAEHSRRASGADYLVANTLEMTTGPQAGAYLVGDGTRHWVRRDELPATLARVALSGTAGGG
jgi:phosphopantothenoylcysteine synthetase/decarboxylase